MKRLPGQIFTIVTIIAVTVIHTPAYAATVSLAPNADTYIELGDADNQLANHGSDTTLELGRFSIFSDFAILISFDLSGIPAGSTINSATLRLFAGPVPYDPLDSFELSNVTSSWDEGTVSGFSALSIDSPAVTVTAATSPVINVIAFVDDWVTNGVDNYGFFIQNTGPNNSGNFNSREAPTGTIPSLEINFTAAVPIPAAVWLFGSGLLGLIGVARRKNAA